MKKSVLSLLAIAIAVITMSSCSKDPAYSGSSDDGEKAAMDFIVNGILNIDDYTFTYTAAQGTLSDSDFQDFASELKHLDKTDEAVQKIVVPTLILTEYADAADTIKSLLKKYSEKGKGMMVIATVKNSKGKIVDTNTWK